MPLVIIWPVHRPQSQRKLFLQRRRAHALALLLPKQRSHRPLRKAIVTPDGLREVEVSDAVFQVVELPAHNTETINMAFPLAGIGSKN